MKRIVLIFGILAICYWFFFLRMPSNSAATACEAYQKNNRMMEGLHTKNDSLWDFTHHKIAEVLPSDVDTLLKIRLLTLKQVKYITSYKYFTQMPTEVQQLIVKTGEQDSIAASKMKQIMQQQIELQNAIWKEKAKLKSLFLGNYFANSINCQ